MGFLGDTSDPNYSSESSYQRTLCQVIWSSWAQPQDHKPGGTSSSTVCLQSTLTNASNTSPTHTPHTHPFSPLWCSKVFLTWSAWLNFSLRKRNWGDRHRRLCTICPDNFLTKHVSWCPISCLALLSGSYYLCCLSPNFQFSTCLPWRSPNGIVLRERWEGGGRSSMEWPLSMLSSPFNLSSYLEYLGVLMRCFQFKSRC